MKKLILYIDNKEEFFQVFKEAFEDHYDIHYAPNGINALKWLDDGYVPDLFVCEFCLPGLNGYHVLEAIRNRKSTAGIPFVFLTCHPHLIDKEYIMKKGANDFFTRPFNKEDILIRLDSLLNLSRELPHTQNQVSYKTYKIPFFKRVLDIAISTTALLFLSPLLLIIAVLIKLDSRGPIIYKSKRAGTGYQIFLLYKFRTMYVDAEERLKELKHLNLYAKATAEVLQEKQETTATAHGPARNGITLYSDHGKIYEDEYIQEKVKTEDKFFKLVNDPRITKVGLFLRNTSLDELPQLFNVLKGEMSLVGNRPLPLYEAELLTTDAWAERFLAPAGLTGLWQVTKRGQADMSEEERIQLDNIYARNCSFWEDIKIILKTFPALLQKESV